MGAMVSQITILTICYSTVYSDADKKTPKLSVTGLCAGNSPGTGEFHAQMASKAENVSIWWRHHGHRCIFWRSFGARTSAGTARKKYIYPTANLRVTTYVFKEWIWMINNLKHVDIVDIVDRPLFTSLCYLLPIIFVRFVRVLLLMINWCYSKQQALDLV